MAEAFRRCGGVIPDTVFYGFSGTRYRLLWFYRYRVPSSLVFQVPGTVFSGFSGTGYRLLWSFCIEGFWLHARQADVSVARLSSFLALHDQTRRIDADRSDRGDAPLRDWSSRSCCWNGNDHATDDRKSASLPLRSVRTHAQRIRPCPRMFRYCEWIGNERRYSIGLDHLGKYRSHPRPAARATRDRPA